MRQTLKALLVEYGAIAVVLYLAIFALVFVGAWAAIRAGWQPTSAIGSASTWVAAYLLTKLTQPLRVIATLALTPLVARGYERVRKRSFVE